MRDLEIRLPSPTILLAEPPELGHLSHQKLSTLAGICPFGRYSGGLWFAADPWASGGKREVFVTFF